MNKNALVPFTVTLLWIALGAAVAQQETPVYSTSWFGNTFGGAGSTLPTRLNNIQMGFDAIAAGPDGTVSTEVAWDESHMEMGNYKDGQDLGQWLEDGPGGGPGGDWPKNQWDFNNADGGAVAANADYVFLSINRTINTKDQGPGWFRCESRATNKPTAFDIQASTARIEGLALNGTNLYVSDKAGGQIKVYNVSDVANIAMTSSFPFVNSSPGRLTVDGTGNLWILDTSKSPAVAREYSSSGTNMNTAITFAATAIITDISFNPVTRQLMVADMGPDQNIKLYNPAGLAGSPTTVAGTLGATHGIYSGIDGQRLPLKFVNPSGVSADASGNIYVAESVPIGTNAQSLHSFGASLSSYTPAGKKNWEVDNLIFVDGAAVDPGDENSAFTKDKHFTLNFSESAPGRGWSYTGHTLDPFAYPQDLRYAGDAFNCNVLAMRRIKGSLFMFVSNMYSNYCGIYRFDAKNHGEIAIPCGLIEPKNTGSPWPPNQPVKGEWIWHDANGDGNFDATEFVTNGGTDAPSDSWGWYVDDEGNIWLATPKDGIREFACQGLDAHGSPLYNYTSMTTTAMPAPFTSLYRAIYDKPTDTMYLTGYTDTFPNTSNRWGKCAGRVAACYKKWSTGNRTADWTLNDLQYATSENSGQDVFIASVAVAGNYLFLQWSGPGANYTGDNQKTQVYDMTNIVNGAPSEMPALLPTSDTSLSVAEIDIPWGMQAYQRTNGEYVVYVEDDWFGKILMYRWTPGKTAAAVK